MVNHEFKYLAQPLPLRLRKEGNAIEKSTYLEVGAGQFAIKSGPQTYCAATGSKIFSDIFGHQVETPTLHSSTSHSMVGQISAFRRSIIFGTASPFM